MNINGIFTLLALLLLGIFFFFQPMVIKEENYGEIPLFKVEDFTLYELNLFGLSTFMRGENGTRFSNRYEVQKINYTDNSQKYLANMVANKGIYKNKQVDLYGDVVYTREDGFRFLTQTASYNKLTAIVSTNTNYEAFMGDEHRLKGSSLQYNNKNKTAYSQNVDAVYKMVEEK